MFDIICMQSFVIFCFLDCFCDIHFTNLQKAVINPCFFSTGSHRHRKHVLFTLPGNMYLSRDNVVAHIVREIFPVATVASNNSLPSQICRLFKLCLIDARSKLFDDLCVEP